jgi:hypothetical protein
LEKHVTSKPIPLVLLDIGVGMEVTLIDTIIHASKVFKTLDLILRDTFVLERPWFKLVPLAELIDTTCEHVDDLVARVKQVVISDWFWGRNLVFKGG